MAARLREEGERRQTDGDDDEARDTVLEVRLTVCGSMDGSRQTRAEASTDERLRCGPRPVPNQARLSTLTSVASGLSNYMMWRLYKRLSIYALFTYATSLVGVASSVAEPRPL